VVKRPRSMGVQVVVDELHPIAGRVIRFDKCFHACSGVNRRAVLADVDKAPAPPRLAGEQPTPGVLALLCVIVPFGPARVHRYRPKHITQEWTGSCRKTSDGTSKLRRLCVLLQDLLPMPHGVAGNFPSAPACDSPRLQGGFFRAGRTASRDMASLTVRSRSLSASHGRVHRP